MGRTQAFNTDEAIRAARTVFWEHGYEDASLPDLERATGLSRSSIYHAFGSKRGLFDAAIKSYLAEIIEPRLRPLNAPAVAPEAITDYFTGLRAALARRDSLSAGNGCLLLNAAGAPIANESAVSEAIAGYRQELNAALSLGIASHRPGLGAVRPPTTGNRPDLPGDCRNDPVPNRQRTGTGNTGHGIGAAAGLSRDNFSSVHGNAAPRR